MFGKSGKNHAQAQNKYPHSDIVPAAKGSGDDKQFSDENSEGRKPGNTGKSGKKGHEGLRHASGKLSGFCDQPAAVTYQDVAG